MITDHEYNTEYTNKTDYVVMLADGMKVLAVGETEIKEVERRIATKYPWWNEDLGGTPWSYIEYVNPGETVKHTWQTMHEWYTPEEAAQMQKDVWKLIGIDELPDE